MNETSSMKQRTYISCPDECGMVIDINDIKKHLLNECCSLLIECPFKTIGCNVKVPKCDMNFHIQGNIIQHMLSYYKQFQLCKERILNNLNEAIKQEYALLIKHIELLIEMKFTQCVNEVKQHIMKLKEQNEEGMFISKKRTRNDNNNNDNTNDNNVSLPSFEALYGVSPIYLPNKEMKVYYDMNKLPDGVYVDNNKVTFKPKLKQCSHKYVFTLCDINTSIQHSIIEWKFVIKAKSGWIGVGVCDKVKVTKNKFLFRSDESDFNSGTFGISTNGFMWNCNNKDENNKRIPGINAGGGNLNDKEENVEVCFRYICSSKELEFYCTKMFNGKLTQVYPQCSIYLTVCVLFLNGGDEVELKLN